MPKLGLIAIFVLAIAAAAKADFVFYSHPRLATPPGDDRVVARVLKYIDEGLEVPEESGQWIFYYSCPEHNTSLVKSESGHSCPVCGRVYDDERTRLAYVTSQHYRLDKACLAMARAWNLTGDDKFAFEVWRVLRRYAELVPGWRRHDRWGRFGMLAVIGGKRYAQGLDDAIGIISLARAYDLIHDWEGITSDDRLKVEKGLFRTTINSIYSMYMLYEGENNHMTWRNAAAAIVGVVIGEPAYIKLALDGSKGFRWQMLNSVTAEGLWCEGALSYHFYALSAINNTLEAAKAVGADMTTELEQRERMLLAPPLLAYPNGYMPTINDSDPVAFKGYRRRYQEASGNSSNPIIQALAAGDPPPQRPSEVLEDAGLVYIRQWGQNPFMAILDFGRHGGAHGHPDKLNLLLYARGRELFPDIGRLSYRVPEHLSWAKQTVAHNTVVLGHRSQKADNGRVIAFKADPDYDYVVAESRGAYRGAIMRRALIMLPDEALVDIFRVEQSGRPVTTDWILHGTVPYSVEGTSQVSAVKRPPASRDGYQHIDFTNKTQPVNNLKLIWQIDQRQQFATWLLHDNGGNETIYQGTGIGYSLAQRHPLIIRSRIGARLTTFAAVHAPNRAAADAWRISQRNGRYIINGPDHEIAWDGAGTVEVVQNEN